MKFYHYILGWTIAQLIRLGMLIVGPMSHAYLQRFSRIGAAVMYAWPSIRKLCIKNIHAAFPDLPPERVKEIAWGSVKSLALSMCEFFWIRRHPDQFDKLVDMSPCRENVLKTIEYNRQGVGAMLITPHFGNWEFAGRILASAFHIKMVTVVKASRLPFFDRMISDSRRSGDVQIIYAKGAARAMKKALDDGLTVGILIDQNTKVRDGGIFVDFLGLPVPVSRSPAVLARGKKYYVAVGAVVRNPDGTNKAYLRELPKPASEYGSDLEMIQDITNITLDFIRQAPEQYCWLYKRFQYIPPDTPPEIRKRFPDYAKEVKPSFYSRSAGKSKPE